MEIAVILVGIVLIIIGFVGSILPALPGPPLAFGALLILFLLPEPKAELAANNYIWLIALGVITILVAIADYLMPVWGAKKFGGTKAGTRGSTIGLIIGALLAFFTAGIGAIAILLGPAVGAYIGEKNAGQSDQVALQSAKGSFLGFLAGTVMKVFIVIAIAIYFAAVVI